MSFHFQPEKNLVMRNTAKFDLSYETPSDETVVTLTINNIEETDDAEYLCEVVVGVNNKIKEKVDLRVRTPVRLDTDSTTEVTVVEGQRASLDCVAAGFPSPRIDWTRKDGAVMFNGKQAFTGSSLVFESVERTDRGEYICEASNNVGPAVNMTANLVVRFGPKITVPRPRVQQAVGYDALLQCNVNSYPTSAIDWLKDGKIIENKRRFSVAHFNTGETSTRTTLKIYGIMEEDIGTYTCAGNNAHGEHSQNVELIKTKIPIPEAAFGGSLSHRTCIFSVIACLATLALSFLVVQ